MTNTVISQFRLDGKTAVITGGGGLLGRQHAAAVAEAGGVPVLWDIDETAAMANRRWIQKHAGERCASVTVDITSPEAVADACAETLNQMGRIDILINNAADNPKVNAGGLESGNRLETLALNRWDRELAVGLTGAFLCSRTIGAGMADAGRGVILNVASDLGLIAPDQRIYRNNAVPFDRQPVKPVTYSVVKHGIIGLTRYLATYWSESGVRVNAICPGGVYTDQSEDFVRKLTSLIPLGRMAAVDEYKAAVVFLVSDASSYMTGANLVVDGGRTCW